MRSDIQTRPLTDLGELTQGLPSRYSTVQSLERAGGRAAYLLTIGDLTGLTVRVPEGEAVGLPNDVPLHYFLQIDDVLIATRTRPPRAAVVVETSARMVPTQNLAMLRPDPDVIDGAYLAAYLSTPEALAVLDRQYDQSAATPLLSLGNLKQIEIPVPPLDVQRQIGRLALGFEQEEEAALSLLNERRALIQQSIIQSIYRSERI